MAELGTCEQSACISVAVITLYGQSPAVFPLRNFDGMPERLLVSSPGSQEATIGTRALAYLRLIHPVPVFFVMLGTGLFGLLAAGGNPELGPYVVMLVAMAGGQVAIGAHNEWRDREHDARHQPEKPIPAGLVDPRAVRPIVVGGLVVGITASTALGFWPLALFLVGAGSGFAYNIWLKRTPLSGIPYLIGLPLLPIWTTLVMDGFEPRLLWLYPLGGAYVVAVHLAQSLSDIEGDRAAEIRGLAVALGSDRTRLIIVGIAFATTALLPLGAFVVSDRPGVAAAAAGLAAILLISLRYRPASEDSHRLFVTICACATILSAGWMLSLSS